MLVELENLELLEINGGCQSCYEIGVKLREIIGVSFTILMVI